jgi:hypothetical protein
MISLREKIVEKLEGLPEPKLREVLTFVDSLTRRSGTQDEPLLSIAGILSGEALSAKDMERELYGEGKKESG